MASSTTLLKYAEIESVATMFMAPPGDSRAEGTAFDAGHALEGPRRPRAGPSGATMKGVGVFPVKSNLRAPDYPAVSGICAIMVGTLSPVGAKAREARPPADASPRPNEAQTQV